MKWLDDLSLRLKLALGPAVCLLLLATAAAGGLWGFAQQRDALDSVLRQRLPAYTFAAAFDSGLRDLNGLVNSSLGLEAMGYSAKEVAAVDQEALRVSAGLKASLNARLADIGSGGAPAEVAALQSLAAHHAKYDKAIKDTLDMKSSGPAIAATFLSTAAKEYRALLAETDRLSKSKLEEAGADVAAAAHAAGRMQAVITAAAASALALGITLSVVLARGLLRRMGMLSRATQSMADGDLAHAVLALGRDEVGRLMGDLEAVRQRLLSSIQQVRDATDSVRVAADEIAAGNADLSQRTEQQAGSLQATASAMEQLGTTVRNNADTARQAAQMAAGASQVAQQGGDVVGRMVATMDEIAGSSRRIADIIGVIDGIAFQTNILALNAAVEAARAGEQGRGFAVVASEVRTLAKRSADAAKEIKSLIQASVERVTAGSDLAAGAGRTMQDIVGQAARVSALIGEISTATNEQSSGIVSVGQSISAIDTTTQQNAALVEQAAAAAESLRQQSLRLADAVSVFRVAGQQPVLG